MSGELGKVRWTRAQNLFLEAAELPIGEREAYLDTNCGSDTDLREEVVSLLRYDAGEESPLLEALRAGAASIVDDESIEGRMLGPYRVEHEIGRGGMSIVYLGSRADGAYRKRVAIKLIKRGMDTQAVVARLYRERSILAALDHSWIARLLDGGAAPDGRPYIVMDFVEGVPIGEYCDSHQLSIDDRCRLMARVCDAVSYAHRNLVVHRDLKPANILIGAEGDPKLLDFGIAKLLGYEAGEASPETRGIRPLTPEYASPEQLAGGKMGTATDVYSLGVVLYELLAGERPRGIGDEIEKVSAAALRRRDRRWSRRLAGDLDNILQVALRTDPERRYLSVGQLQADLNLRLKGLPVSARNEGVFYRVRKFVLRHRLGTAAAVLLVLSVTGGMAGILWQARRTEAERQIAETRRSEAEQEAQVAAAAQKRAEAEHAEAETQKTNADGEREIADRRFAQVRELAGKFLFDFHDAVTPLPGSTPVRKMVVDTGVRYYDSLVKEAGNNRDLLEEIARGYDRLGDVTGNPYYGNLGDQPGAVAGYTKALAIRRTIVDGSPEFLRDRIMGNVRISQMLQAQSKYAESIRNLKEAIAWVPSPNTQPAIVRDALATAWSVLGDSHMRSGDNPSALKSYNQLVALREDLVKTPAADGIAATTTERNFASAEMKLGDYCLRNSFPEQALPALNKAREILTRLLAADPNNTSIARLLRIDEEILSQTLYGIGSYLAKPGEATALLRDVARLSERELTPDPTNRQALEGISLVYTDLGESLRRDKDFVGAKKAWETGFTYAQRLPQIPADDGIRSQVVRRLGWSASDEGKPEEALEYLRKAEELALATEKNAPDDTMKIVRIADINDVRADVYMTAKRWQDAIDMMKLIIASYEALAGRDPGDPLYREALPPYYAKLGDCYAGAGDKASARLAMQKALDLYGEMEAKHPLLGGDIRDRDVVRNKMAAL